MLPLSIAGYRGEIIAIDDTEVTDQTSIHDLRGK
jgi:hypothetical protein